MEYVFRRLSPRSDFGIIEKKRPPNTVEVGMTATYYGLREAFSQARRTTYNC